MNPTNAASHFIFSPTKYNTHFIILFSQNCFPKGIVNMGPPETEHKLFPSHPPRLTPNQN